MPDRLPDTSELVELWSEDHIQQLCTFEHFHNIHQVKLDEALDALSAKCYKKCRKLATKVQI